MAFIEVEHLSKTFCVRQKRAKGHIFREKTLKKALDNVSFTVEKGEMVGYIGPNGAGKSTTVKILSGILTPDGGVVHVDGRVPYQQRKAHVRNIGVVFGQRTQLWWDVPLLDSYHLLGDIYRVEPKKLSARLEELTSALELSDLLLTPLRQLSLGQRMRAELCGSLLHCPQLLFLDEPTIGLDAVSKLALRDFLLRENAQNGTTVLLTTHDTQDIAALCKRVMVLGHGQKLFDGALETLMDTYDTTRVAHARFSGAPDLSLLPADVTYTRAGEQYDFAFPHQSMPTPKLLALLQQAGTLEEFTTDRQPLDLMIAQMYREMAL